MDHPQVPNGAEGAKRGLFHATVYPGLGPRLWKAPVVARLHPRPSNLPLRLHGIPVICLLFMALVSKIVIRFHTVHPRRQSVQEQKEEKNKYYSVGGPEHTSTRNEKKRSLRETRRARWPAGRVGSAARRQAAGTWKSDTRLRWPLLFTRLAAPEHAHMGATHGSCTSSKPRRWAGCRPPHGRLSFLSAPLKE